MQLSGGTSLAPVAIGVVVGVVLLVAGIVQYRRRERWFLATLIMPPAGVLLGWYADHRGWVLVGTAAFALTPLALLARVVMNRRRRAQ